MDKILGKIEKLFFEKAFDELSMEEIGNNLGIKKSSIYYYFQSKEDMFLKVLSFSYEKYKIFLENILKEDNHIEIIKTLITYPYEEKNLFSVVLQRGYCRIESVKSFISEKIFEIQQIFYEKIGLKYGLSQEKLVILRSVIEDLSKKYCILKCPSKLEFEKIVEEIAEIFFKSKAN